MELITYHRYDEQGFATGETIEAAEKPERCFEWAPPKCPEDQCAWFDGVGWRTVPDVSVMKLDQAKERLNDELTNTAFLYDGDLEYSEAERDSFDVQYQEALAIKDGNPAGVYISALMKVYQLSAGDMADKILARRELRNLAHAQFNAEVQAVRLRIKNAKSIKELPTIDVLMKLREPVKI